MADTTTDTGATTIIEVEPAPTIDPATVIIVEPTPANTPVDTPTNEAAANTPIVIATPAPSPSPTASTNSITSTPISSSTFITSGRPSSTTGNGSPFSGPPPFLTAGGRPPFATGSGRPSFFDDDEPQPLSAGAKAGIGVGVVALIFSIAAVVLLLWRMKKKKREEEDDNLTPMGDEPLPAYTEASSSSHKKVATDSPAMEMKPKSAMKKVAQPAPMFLDLHGSGSSTPVYGTPATERRRSYQVEGSDQPLVLSIWEPANKSATSLASSSNNSPILGPVVPPKSHRKSNPGSRPRRKSNLAPVHEELPESRRKPSKLALVEDNGEGSSSAPPTPRTPRTAAFHALTGGSGASSGQVSPMDASFSLDPVPPLPGGVSPTNSRFGDKK